MSSFNVRVEVAGVPGVADEDTVALLAKSLAEYTPAIALEQDGSGIGVSMNLTADSPAEVSSRASSIVEQALGRIMHQSGKPRNALAVVEIEAKTLERLEREIETPNYPDLCGITELARMIGVTRQRASALAASPGFPRPLAVLASGPVWPKAWVQRFVDAWPRRAGRPSKAAAER